MNRMVHAGKTTSSLRMEMIWTESSDQGRGDDRKARARQRSLFSLVMASLDSVDEFHGGVISVTGLLPIDELLGQLASCDPNLEGDLETVSITPLRDE